MDSELTGIHTVWLVRDDMLPALCAGPSGRQGARWWPCLGYVALLRNDSQIGDDKAMRGRSRSLPYGIRVTVDGADVLYRFACRRVGLWVGCDVNNG